MSNFPSAFPPPSEQQRHWLARAILRKVGNFTKYDHAFAQSIHALIVAYDAARSIALDEAHRMLAEQRAVTVSQISVRQDEKGSGE